MEGRILRNLDDLLGDVARMPLPTLASLDDAVMAALAERQGEARAISRILSAAAVLALGVGYAGGSFMTTPASAADKNLVLAENALAPSTLLDFL